MGPGRDPIVAAAAAATVTASRGRCRPLIYRDLDVRVKSSIQAKAGTACRRGRRLEPGADADEDAGPDRRGTRWPRD